MMNILLNPVDCRSIISTYPEGRHARRTRCHRPEAALAAPAGRADVERRPRTHRAHGAERRVRARAPPGTRRGDPRLRRAARPALARVLAARVHPRANG